MGGMDMSGMKMGEEKDHHAKDNHKSVHPLARLVITEGKN